MKHMKTTLLVALVLIVMGAGSLMFFRDRQVAVVTPPASAAQIAAARASVPKAPDVISGEPVRLQIPSLNIDLQIIPGVYNSRTRQWTLTSDKVQYAVMTPQPNNKEGNTFIYGHYRRGVLSTLHNIAPGSKAIITTDNGKTFTYVLNNSRVVSPEDSSAVFDYQGKPILTIQTCTGVFFENRQLFEFNLESVS